MKKVLLITSNDEQLVELARYLGMEGGHDVHGCASLVDALMVLEAFEPDVIITDWNVGDHTGDVILEQLVGYCQTSCHSKPVAITIYGEDQITTEVIAAACTDPTLAIKIDFVLKDKKIGPNLLQLIAQAQPSDA